jgi:DNA polymerase-3 subunit gamma/tau
MAVSLNVPALTRAWQILSKGAEEMRYADNTSVILEMILVRLGYASALPSPAELVRNLSYQSPVTSRQLNQNGSAHSASPPAGEATRLSERSEFSRSGEGAVTMALSAHSPLTQPSPARGEGLPLATATAQKIEPAPLAEAHDFLEVVELFESRREPILATHLINDMRLVSFSQGRIEVKPIAHMNADVAARINRRLTEWTGARWNLTFTNDAEGEPTIREQRARAAAQARDYAVAHPKVQAVLNAFPGAKVIDFVPSKPTA